jgi:hypothetical protein
MEAVEPEVLVDRNAAGRIEIIRGWSSTVGKLEPQFRIIWGRGLTSRMQRNKQWYSCTTRSGDSLMVCSAPE